MLKTSLIQLNIPRQSYTGGITVTFKQHNSFIRTTYGVRSAYFLSSKEKVGSLAYVISLSDETAISTTNKKTQG
jgi:hypothetical protein